MKRSNIPLVINLAGTAVLLALLPCLSQPAPWSIALLLYLAVTLGLTLRYPRLLDLAHHRSAFCRYGGMMPILCGSIGLLPAFSRFAYTGAALRRIGLLSLVLTGLILLSACPFLCKRASALGRQKLTLVMLILIFSVNMVGHINATLSPEVPDPVTATVTRLHRTTSGKRRRGYHVYAQLPDGTVCRFTTSKAVYDSLSTGDPLSVACYEGQLRIPYQRLLSP